jgi:hypothetical protein
MKRLEKQVADLRKHYTRSLKNFGGSMMLKEKRGQFDERVAALREELDVKRESLLTRLSEEITNAQSRIAAALLPRVLENPPQSLKSSVPEPLTDESAEGWLSRRLENCFPTAAQILDGMKLECVFKDVTFETLNTEDFLEALKKAWPDYPWDKPMMQYRAARETATEGQESVA